MLAAMETSGDPFEPQLWEWSTVHDGKKPAKLVRGGYGLSVVQHCHLHHFYNKRSRRLRPIPCVDRPSISGGADIFP